MEIRTDLYTKLIIEMLEKEMKGAELLENMSRKNYEKTKEKVYKTLADRRETRKEVYRELIDIFSDERRLKRKLGIMRW